MKKVRRHPLAVECFWFPPTKGHSLNLQPTEDISHGSVNPEALVITTRNFLAADRTAAGAGGNFCMATTLNMRLPLSQSLDLIHHGATSIGSSP